MIPRRKRRRSERNRKRRVRKRQRKRKRSEMRRSVFSVFRRRTLFVTKCTSVISARADSTNSETGGSGEDQGEDEATASERPVWNRRGLPPMAQ